MSALCLLLLSVAPLRSPVSEDPERLARALATIDVDALESDLSFLADDELEGRDTPSEGLEIAALYLATRLERLGFQSAGSGDFYHRWSLRRTGLDGEASALRLTSRRGERRWALGEDYFLAKMSHAFALDLEGDLVSVGTGTSDEFEAAELSGAWALLSDRGTSARRIQRYAVRAGAIGVVFCETPDSKRPYAASLSKTAETITTVRTTYEVGSARDRRAEDVPYVMLAAPAAAELLRAGRGAPADWEGDFPPAGTQLPLRLREERVRVTGEVPVVNVAGFWPGRDPELAEEVLIVSAHYDHVGTRGAEIYNGADDNASGTSGLLGVAEALAAYGPMRRSVLLLWVSGEEKGLWGSRAWTATPQLPADCVPVADLNIDMIGRTAPEELYLTPTDDHAAFNTLAQAAYDLAPLEGFPSLRSQDEDWQRSDHYNFSKHLEIPVAFLSGGEHPDYHKPTDTSEKIDYDKLARITRLVVRLLDRVEDGPILPLD